MIYPIIFVIAVLIVFELYIWRDAKKAHYNALKREFERELDQPPPNNDDDIIRDFYDTGESPKVCAYWYKESKRKALCADE